MKRSAALVLSGAVLLTLTACGSADGTTQDAAPGGADLTVTAAFYPLQWAGERVGGERVTVRGLTKPGAEPHDLELTPKAVGELASSDVVVYLKGFQPAVDDAVATQGGDAALDVGPEAGLTLAGSQASPDGPPDPHFWLDPVRFQGVVTAIGERFASIDAPHAAEYRANAAALVKDLGALDAEFEQGLAQCRSDALVTGHVAFAYLADRYDLRQEGIAGVSPDVEPDAAALRELVAHVEELGVSTVYSETLVDPALAETLARETGAKVAVLDPLEGLTDSSAGTDYLEVMRSNLATLKAGQECT